jgi:predicted thioredoxin/glutaredoxin
MLIEVFAHPQCHVCHRLLKDLRSLHERYPSVELKIIDVERDPYEAQQRNILGVPATFIDGSLAFVGAPPTGELESYLQGRKAQLPEETKNVETVAELAVEALGSISTTAIRFYLYGDYESLFQNTSLSARLMRIRDWKAIDEKALRDMLVARGGSLLEMKKTMFLEKISSEFVREIYWLYDEYPSRDEIEQLYPTNVFAHWLMTKASMGGRIGQNIRKLSDRSLMQRVIAARQFTLNNYEGLCEKVAGQQESINN